MSTNDLQALFANLRPKARDSPAPSQSSNGINRPNSNGLPSQSVGVSPSPSNPLQAFPSVAKESSYNQMASAPGSGSSATAQSLLSLLNFGAAPQPSANNNAKASLTARAQDHTAGGAGDRPTRETATPLSASDLVAKFTSPPPPGVRAKTKAPFNLEDQGGGGGQSQATTGRDASQELLLKLLNKAHPSNTTVPPPVSAESVQIQMHANFDRTKPTKTPTGTDSLVRPLVSNATAEVTPSEATRSENKPLSQEKPIFTYTNPFEALNASRSQTPKMAVPAPISKPQDIPQRSIETGNEEFWEGASPDSTPAATPAQVAKRRILTPRLPSASKQGTISREASVSAPEKEQDLRDTLAKEDKVASPLKPASGEAESRIKVAIPSGPSNGAKSDESSMEEKTTGPQPEGGDEWEDTEESPNKEFSPRLVPVYNFPIKPFVSMTLQLGESSDVAIRDDGVMDISRLKKEFDQLDRSLAAATSKYITYALSKNGGMRIIRQDDGNDRQVFKNSHDRVFNIALCTTSSSGPPSDDQAVLGTGVSGAVFYATISKGGNDLFEKDELETESLIFPPYPPADENTAGGVLKTRAKRSSRHPEFFAIGRGKAIHLVWPATAISPRYGITEDNRRVDIERFFQERALQISTGKAGKDFTFSEDDTLIVSLDKTGRLRFWDIRKLTDESNATAPRVASMTVDMPLLSLSTAAPAEKSWPTSVLFVDKARPYIKGGALRYVLVGLRQNHTLQLWDVALGKAVQEVNFPHENETDGICSVNYHANSGIIIVGHPTRNSLFYIHLSAPRYTLSSSLSQAAYIQRIAAKDPDLPKPESTACMSGIREISFGGKGKLRSVELLPIHRSSEAQKAADVTTPLFELYVVHSKGVTCLTVTKEDLGWNAESKVIHAIDAAKEGIVTLKELRLGSVIEETPRSKSPVEEVQQPVKSSKKKAGKKADTATDQAESVLVETQDVPPAVPLQGLDSVTESQPEIPNGDAPSSKPSKKSKKKAAQQTEASVPDKASPRTLSPTKNARASTKTTGEAGVLQAEESVPTPALTVPLFTQSEETRSKADAVSVGISGDWLDKEMKKVERSVSSEFRKELNVLYQNIQKDRVVQDSSSIARQEALLRLVSTTLTNNVETALSRILAAQMHQSMIPALTGVTVQAVSSQVGEAVAKSLHSIVPRELGVHLPAAINATLQSPQMSRTIAEIISQKIAKQGEAQLADILQKQVLPAFKSLAISSAEKAALDVEVRLRSEIRQLETDRKHDMDRLEKLGQVLQATAETLQQMSDTQVAFQGQILKDRRQLALLGESSTPGGSQQVSTSRMTPSPQSLLRQIPVQQKTAEELELEEITELMNDGRYEEGSIKWLQSSQPVELFDRLFIHFTPEYLATDVSPLIAFSIAVTIGNSLTTNTARRLEWIAAAFMAVDLNVSRHASNAPVYCC